MYCNDTKDQFLELRAKGISLARIATDLHVSQRTLVEWNLFVGPLSEPLSGPLSTTCPSLTTSAAQGLTAMAHFARTLRAASSLHCNSPICSQAAKMPQPRMPRMPRIKEIRVHPCHPWLIPFLGCGFAALRSSRLCVLIARPNAPAGPRRAASTLPSRSLLSAFPCPPRPAERRRHAPAEVDQAQSGWIKLNQAQSR
jgi:hypothetical protein